MKKIIKSKVHLNIELIKLKQSDIQIDLKSNVLQKAMLLGLIFLIFNSSSTAQDLAWAKSMGGSFWDSGQSITVDGAGNVYTTGYFRDTVDFDPNSGVSNLISQGQYDIFIQKLDAAGNLLWAKSMGGTSDDRGESIAVDGFGNVYTTGRFYNTVDFDPNSGVSNLISQGQYDIFIQKLDTAGNFLWAKSMGGTNTDEGYSITIDGSGNVYTTGFFRGTVDFDPNLGVSSLISQGGDDIFIQKLDAAGNLLWAKSMGGTSTDKGESITVDGLGNVYTTGRFRSNTADFDPNPGVSNLIGQGQYDIFIQKIDTAGNFLWAKSMGGTDNDYGFSTTVDGLGNVYTTGTFHNTVDFDPNSGVSNLTSLIYSDIFIQKLDAAGNFLWAKSMGGTTSGAWDKGHSITVDGFGNVYTTGVFSGTVDFDPNSGVSNLITLGGGQSMHLSKN